MIPLAQISRHAEVQATSTINMDSVVISRCLSLSVEWEAFPTQVFQQSLLLLCSQALLSTLVMGSGTARRVRSPTPAPRLTLKGISPPAPARTLCLMKKRPFSLMGLTPGVRKTGTSKDLAGGSTGPPFLGMTCFKSEMILERNTLKLYSNIKQIKG